MKPLLIAAVVSITCGLALAGRADGRLSAAADPDDPFAQGNWTFQTYGSVVVGDDDKGELYSVHSGFGYFFLDDVSVNLEGVGGYVDAARDDDGGFGGLDLYFAWHLLRGENWSLFISGGAGLQQASTNFPSDSHFNFRLQTGLGATLQLTDTMSLIGGARYIHISNAGISEVNDGLDGALLFTGLMVRF